jgi:hypothetical protein
LPVALTVIDPESATAPPDAVIDTSPLFASTDDESTEIDVPATSVALVPAVTDEPPLTVIDPLGAVSVTLPAVAVTAEDNSTITDPPAANDTF